MSESGYRQLVKGIEVKTPTGYKTFDGIKKSLHDQYIEIMFSDLTIIECSFNHRFFINDEWRMAQFVISGDVISGKEVVDIAYHNKQKHLYDLVNVDGSCYFTNGVLSHNCHWISTKGTLVNSLDIEAIKTKDPVQQVGDLEFFVDSLSGRKLMLAADVSEGIGQDYHAFQVFDVDSLEQVAEYHNNTMNQKHYANAIIKFIEHAFKEGASEIYYTVENNGVGAGVIRLLESSENQWLEQATIISDPNGMRAGLATTGKTKAKSCATFKDMVENHRLTIHSEKLKVQMKFFVKTGSTFKAESGTHDDLVMACIIMMNMMEQLANYEDNIYDAVHDLDTDSDGDWSDIYF